jgi:putative hydrolase of the HAD superfamily
VSLRAVLFDATGTLIELREPVGETYARFARRFGADLPAWRLGDAFRRVLGRAPPLVFPAARPEELDEREREWWRAVVRGTFLAADSALVPRDFPRLFAALYQHFGTGEAWRVRPGARAALVALRSRGLRTGCVSNFDHRLRNILQAIGIADLLDAVILPSDCAAEKPDPRIFQAALAALQVSAAEALYVGDDPERDLAGAAAAGLRAIDARELASLDELAARVTAPATLGP